MDGLMAARRVRVEMDRAGLGRTSTLNGGELTGWTTSWGSTGFSVRDAGDDATVIWNVVLSGKAHLDYRRTDRDEDLHEPIYPEALSPAIRSVFGDMGMQVRSIDVGGWQGMWDDDINYAVRTDWPEWLERGNRPGAPVGDGALELATFATGGRFDEYLGVDTGLLRGLAGYVDGEDALLTRESVEKLVAVAKPHIRTMHGIHIPEESRCAASFDGQLLAFSAGRANSLRALPETVANAWGDEVEAWRMPGALLRREASFRPSVPFMMSGTMREKVREAEIDAQYFPTVGVAPGPRGP